MRWLDRLERRFGRWSIPNLMNLVIIGQVLVWFITMFVNYHIYDLLTLTRDGLAHLQLWRAVTFVFIPTLTTRILYLILEEYFYWWVGNSLERAWGDFRFMVYWLAGMVGAILSCLITGYGSTSGLFLSLFFAYAWMWPDQQILLFFIIPLKVKWLGWAAAVFWAIDFIFGTLSVKLSLVFGLAGFLLVAGTDHTITTTIAGGRGFTAVMVSWMAGFNPLNMIFTSFLLVFLERGAAEISTKFALNHAFGDILTGIILFFIIGSEFFIRYEIRRSHAKKEG